MLTEAERATVAAGHKMERLLASADFQAWMTALEEYIAGWQVLALAKGETEFEKGTVNGLHLARSVANDTVEEMKRLLAAETAQHPVGGENVNIDNTKDGEYDSDLDDDDE